ncbi:MAG: hypothetical protein JNM22_00645 [Saprospiraceae bacterium]|nr:hypothetical protein [Saprospiraceae bacterium]
MKSWYKLTLLLVLGSIFAGIVSCKKEDDKPNGGAPAVYYIRSTDPALSDSLLVGTFMGSLIAIVGDNLADTREIWFNDQKATLNPSYITAKTILVNVPSTVPSTVTNKIRFVFGDGSELLHDFSINIPAPVIAGTKCEYVPDGGTLVLYGDFFFEPKVTFPGDLQGEITSLTKTEIQVKVPDGAEPGNIVVKTNFGTAKSGFLFRDNRNVLLDYDGRNHETWTAPIVNSPLAPCSGNYAFFKHAADGAWMWTNELTMQYWAPRGRGNVPVATGNISDLVLRFEANVPIEWRDVRMEIFFAPFAEDHGRDVPGTVFARWKPWKNGPYTTDGWVTISIPLTEFKYTRDDADDNENGSTQISNLNALTNVTMMLFGPANGPNPVQIAIDNVRIVQK